MAQASIQITQGALVGGASQSVLGLVPTTAVTLTDAAGAGALSYLWEVLSWPSPDSAPPTVTDSTSQVATITPSTSFTDGVYLVRLTRSDGTGTTSDVRAFGVADADGLHLPSWGLDRNNSNFGGSATASLFGWQGTAAASNTLLDAFLRLRRTREGKVRISGTDTTYGQLVDKLVAGANVSITTQNPGGNEQLVIAASSGASETVISPTALDTDTNDWSPTGWSSATTVRVTTSAEVTCTGLASAATAVKKLLIIVGNYTVTLAHQSTSSLSGNRFIIPGGGNLRLGPDDSVWLYYDATTLAWRVC